MNGQILQSPGRRPSRLGLSASHLRVTGRGTSTRTLAGDVEAGRQMEFLTALGQDVTVTVKPTRKEQGEMEVVVG